MKGLGGENLKFKISSQSINKYNKELNVIFKEVKGNQRLILNKQIDQVSFMLAQSDELEKILQENGSVEWFENGKQKMWREHPASKIYIATSKNLLSYLEKMKQMLPEESKGGNELNNFLQKKNMKEAK